MQVPWSRPEIGEEEKGAVIRVVESGWLTQGKETKQFEEELCKYIGCKHAVVVNNGTSALIVSLLAHGIGPGDEVIVPSFTFMGSINSILAVGAKPVLVDSDLKTFNTTTDLVKEKITDKTKAIMPVDVAGMPVDIVAFEDLAKEQDLILIEDAAEALGAEYRKKRIGSFDHTSIISFHIGKACTTIEGGCVTTNGDDVAEKLRLVRNHGMQRQYDHKMFGLNFRITDLQSAIGRVQLKKLDSFISKRIKFAGCYMKELGDMFSFQTIPEYVTLHPWMFFPILTEAKGRDKIIEWLNKNGVDTRICWPITHKQKFHSKIFKNERCPNAESISSKIITIPMGNALKQEEIDYVIRILKMQS
jgi:dTDP-4-amino-4,6-dideoxygalactose transaminase